MGGFPRKETSISVGRECKQDLKCETHLGNVEDQLGQRAQFILVGGVLEFQYDIRTFNAQVPRGEIFADPRPCPWGGVSRRTGAGPGGCCGVEFGQ